jgi:hypothetical protein
MALRMTWHSGADELHMRESSIADFDLRLVLGD